jgi:hypothetical protein
LGRTTAEHTNSTAECLRNSGQTDRKKSFHRKFELKTDDLQLTHKSSSNWPVSKRAIIYPPSQDRSTLHESDCCQLYALCLKDLDSHAHDRAAGGIPNPMLCPSATRHV